MKTKLAFACHAVILNRLFWKMIKGNQKMARKMEISDNIILYEMIGTRHFKTLHEGATALVGKQSRNLHPVDNATDSGLMRSLVQSITYKSPGSRLYPCTSIEFITRLLISNSSNTEFQYNNYGNYNSSSLITVCDYAH